MIIAQTRPMHIESAQIISYETFLQYQTRRYTKHLLDACVADLLAARATIRERLIASGQDESWLL